jgi:hypothetical protein
MAFRWASNKQERLFHALAMKSTDFACPYTMLLLEASICELIQIVDLDF